jgi:AraC family transcriptional regulator, regulatory protein of adaptative response / DNA-3-methyladenine glycosylase II
VDVRDARFDGVFYVAIVTTGIFCRPVCPSRRANAGNRRFFRTRIEAERAGFRPCRRCRPELAPGRAECDSVARLAIVAARRIAAGALDGRRVDELALEFGVSTRHLRRVLARELGASPVSLALAHRLTIARGLLRDSTRSITSVAFESGFQSLRRFNTAFHRRYGMSPSALRRHSAS